MINSVTEFHNHPISFIAFPFLPYNPFPVISSHFICAALLHSVLLSCRISYHVKSVRVNPFTMLHLTNVSYKQPISYSHVPFFETSAPARAGHYLVIIYIWYEI